MKELLLAVSIVLAMPAMAQEHSGHAMPMATGNTAASEAFAAANAKMHEYMAMELTGIPDVDFIRNMIPHHQGAVEMARIELEHGTNPKVKAFAEAVIAAQEEEIAWMQAWLAKNGG
jgi:uncharacterized protein (DUF305 family)